MKADVIYPYLLGALVVWVVYMAGWSNGYVKGASDFNRRWRQSVEQGWVAP